MIDIDKYKKINYYTYQDNNLNYCDGIIIHIHGAGSRGNNINLAIDSNPIIRYINNNKNFSYKLYCPQCYADTWFDIYEQLIDFINYVIKKEPHKSFF